MVDSWYTDNRDFDSFFEKVVKINGAKIYHNTSLLPHNHRGNSDKTGRGYLVRKKASCFVSSFFGTEITNLMPILAHRFD